MELKEVLPAHAGVILLRCRLIHFIVGITRTCGGDPVNASNRDEWKSVLPAHAGVILLFS